jgi:hypothetical protein
MKDINNILEITQKYNEAYKMKAIRFQNWSEQTKEFVRQTLLELCKQISNNNYFFQGNISVDRRNESVCLISGQITVPSDSTLFENGFEIYFMPLQNGKIHVYAIEHSISSEGIVHSIEIINDSLSLTEEKIYKSSFLFIGD